MGFRNPITTAKGVDTGGTGQRYAIGPDGVIFYSGDPDETSPGQLEVGVTEAGLVELERGYMKWSPPEVGQAVPAHERVGLSALGRTRDGSEQGRWLFTGRVDVEQPLTGPDTWSPLSLTADWEAWDGATNMPRLRRDAAGNVHLVGIVKLKAGKSIGAGGAAAVATLPAGYAIVSQYGVTRDEHRPSLLLTPAGGWYGAAWMFVSGNKVFVINTNTSSPLGAGYGWTIGTSYRPW